MRKMVFMIVAVAVSASATATVEAQPKFTNKAIEFNMTGAKCPARVRRFLPLAQAAEAANAKNQAADIYASMAGCYGAMGQLSKGARYLRKAISMGMDDCSFMKIDAGVKKLPNYNAMLHQLKMSRADWHELSWLVREIQATNHDTSVMIAGNMNRKDGGTTPTFAPTLPARTPTSQSVRLYRWGLVYMFNNQRKMVMRSDQARIKHLVSMNIIGNMGTGNNYYAKQRQINYSKRLAAQAAATRKRATQQRAFRAGRLSNRKISCAKLR